jgi:hypothetical protein
MHQLDQRLWLDPAWVLSGKMNHLGIVLIMSLLKQLVVIFLAPSPRAKLRSISDKIGSQLWQETREAIRTFLSGLTTLVVGPANISNDNPVGGHLSVFLGLCQSFRLWNKWFNSPWRLLTQR